MHECPVTNCTTQVDSGVYMCARHWRMVPRPLQAAVYETFRATHRVGDNHAEALRVVNEAEAGLSSLGLPPGTKALTLWQPWATLIMLGAKPYEFRRWNFTDKPHLAPLVGQRIVIHAGARKLPLAELLDMQVRIMEGESALKPEIALPFVKKLIMDFPECGDDLPFAAALGTCVIGNPVKSFDLFKHIVADSDRLDHQMWAWPITDVKPFGKPIPARGAQGFWKWS